MARNANVIADPQIGMDVSEIFHDSTEMPRPTSLEFPDMVGTANAGLGAYTSMTPQSLNQRMPSIIEDTPQDLTPAPSCGAISQWINENPLPAVGLLAALATVVFMGKKK